MTKSHLTLDEALMTELYGDAIRTDVFPSRGHSTKTLTAGNPTDSFYFVDNSGRTILLFKLDGNRVTSVYSPRSASEVLRFIDDLSSSDSTLSSYLRSQLESLRTKEGEMGCVQINDGHELLFKPYSSRMSLVSKHDLRKGEEALETLLSYHLDRLPKSSKLVYNGDMCQVVTVVQKEYAIVSAKKGDKKVANTFGLADCIGLTLHDEDTQVAAVAHIDSGTDIKSSIPRLMSDLSEVGGNRYNARLFGGDKNSATQFVALVEALKGYPVEFVEADILDNAQSRSIGISTGGMLYNHTFEDRDPTMGDRMRISGVAMNIPLTCHYKP